MWSAAALAERRERSLAQALGPELAVHLDDPDVLEILARSDGSVWLDRHSCGLERTPPDLDPRRAEALLTSVAGLLDRELRRESPTLEGELPRDGSRITATIPPVTPGPSFAIRKRAEVVYRLDDYLRAGMLRPEHAWALRAAMAWRPEGERTENVVIAGGPGSGKTTFANALLAEVGADGAQIEHLALVEDTLELQCVAPCREYYRTTPELGLGYMVRHALRQRPDRIVVGEVRGGEAQELLKAWNTGTGSSLATVHANSARDALDRLDYLVQEAGVPSGARLVGDSVHLVAFLVRTARGRRVAELLRIHGWTPAAGYRVEPL